jgi:hypothetical protein
VCGCGCARSMCEVDACTCTHFHSCAHSRTPALVRQNCFKRIFQREGKYSSFGEATLPQNTGTHTRSDSGET